jgi:hypothetical protein
MQVLARELIFHLFVCRIKVGASKLKQSTIPSTLLKKKSTASPAVAPTTPAIGGNAGGSSSSSPCIEAEFTITPPSAEGAKDQAASGGAGKDSRVEALADDTLATVNTVTTGEGSQPPSQSSRKKASSSTSGSSRLPKKPLTKEDVLYARKDAINAMVGRADIGGTYDKAVNGGDDVLANGILRA